MSAERDVVFFLMKHKILDITEAIITDCKNPRLMVCKIMIIVKVTKEVRAHIVKKSALRLFERS